ARRTSRGSNATCARTVHPFRERRCATRSSGSRRASGRRCSSRREAPMGAEAKCTARFKGKTATGTARLETDVVQFRGGDLKLSIPFKTMTRIAARDGLLTIATPDGEASFELGNAAAKWAEKIKHPPSRLDKIGVKPEWRASAIGVDDEVFLAEL